jgi:hypothetical protein
MIVNEELERIRPYAVVYYSKHFLERKTTKMFVKGILFRLN